MSATREVCGCCRKRELDLVYGVRACEACDNVKSWPNIRKGKKP